MVKILKNGVASLMCSAFRSILKFPKHLFVKEYRSRKLELNLLAGRITT